MRPTAVTMPWGDGEYTFDLPLGMIREVEDKCGAGVFVVFGRFAGQACSATDIREVIRCGLIGGGLTPSEARSRVALYVDERPLIESLPVALAVLEGLILGAPSPKPDEVAENPQKPAKADASTLLASTEPERF